MAIDPQLLAQMAQTMYVAAESSVDAYGQVTFGSPSSFSARVEEEYREINNADGDVVRTTHRVYTTQALIAGQRIWLPGEDQSSADAARQIQQVHTIPDENGNVHHYEALV